MPWIIKADFVSKHYDLILNKKLLDPHTKFLNVGLENFK